MLALLCRHVVGASYTPQPSYSLTFLLERGGDFGLQVGHHKQDVTTVLSWGARIILTSCGHLAKLGDMRTTTWFYSVLLLLVATVASAKDASLPKGAHDGITVRVETATYSRGGKRIVVTATHPETQTGFVLVCRVAEGDCAFPQVGATYTVISVAYKSTETWAFVTNGMASLFYLVWAGQ